MTERTVSTGGGQCDSEADGPADCEVIFSILCFIYAKVDGKLFCSGTNQLCVVLT